MVSISGLPTLVLVLIFCASAALVWAAGKPLTTSTDALSERWHLGEALGGLILLGIVTNLPEVAITIGAAVRGTMDLAVGNLLGGIPMQLMVLVLLDRAARDPKPLSNLAADASVEIECLLCMGLLGFVAMAPAFHLAHNPLPVGVPDVLVVVGWVSALLIMSKLPRSRASGSTTATPPGGAVGRRFVLAAGATLVGGMGLEAASDALSQRWGISGLLFGATVLAAATSLPELTTGLAALREKEYDLSVSDIVGGNSVLVVLLVVGSVISGSSAFERIDASAVTLAAIGIVMSAVLTGGLIIAPKRRVAGLGPDSWMMTAVFVVGLFGLYLVGG